jgi:phage terminase small subunit
VLVIIARFKSFDSKASHLLKLVQIQAIIREEAKKAAREKHFFAKELAHSLINLILKS